MAWRRIGDKPLSVPMLTQFTDAYVWHWGRWVDWTLENKLKWNVDQTQWFSVKKTQLQMSTCKMSTIIRLCLIVLIYTEMVQHIPKLFSLNAPRRCRISYIFIIWCDRFHIFYVDSNFPWLKPFSVFFPRVKPGIILCMCPANERRRYSAT